MQDLYVILGIIIIFGIGYQVGTFITVMKMLELFKEMTGREMDLEELTDEEILDEARSMVFITENINNILYMYTGHGNMFVCQGNTLEELCTRCKEYTNLNDIFVIHEKQTYHYDGKVVEKVKNED